MTAAHPAAGLLDRRRAALVVVDIQEKLLPAIFEKQRLLANTLLLMRAAAILDVPIVLTSQYRKGLGDVLAEVKAAAPEVPVLDKATFGCFGDGGFLAHLAALGARDQLVVTGIESHICVTQTTLGALARGYTVHVAADAVSSRSESNWRTGLSRMERAGAVVSSSEMALYELLGRSDGAEFKRVLPLLKG